MGNNATACSILTQAERRACNSDNEDVDVVVDDIVAIAS